METNPPLSLSPPANVSGDPPRHFPRRRLKKIDNQIRYRRALLADYRIRLSLPLTTRQVRYYENLILQLEDEISERERRAKDMLD